MITLTVKHKPGARTILPTTRGSALSMKAAPRGGAAFMLVLLADTHPASARSSSGVSCGPSSVTRESSRRKRWITGRNSCLTCSSL